ncbi:LysR family transcriptional regulator [Streptococcus cuniculi]|uniref:LysR family transcriptional regulator n=1 Tax=Streptococcus cuniculi TaxID=1432788 RepID=A0A1Q8EAM0_9STRE|nr:LysR family transcriptional regulator [Streptococcus cuniculi]OLF48841.1 LysR family transcriptional regulator [Streptococcus cuniculi]
MEIRVLRYFLEAARMQNMSKAAAQLHVTQPTLSRQIKDLEEELGHPLFHRSNHSVSLTSEGEIFYQRALAIVGMVDRTIAEFEAMQGFQGGEICIGCAESEGIHLIAKAAKHLRQDYPNMIFHLYSGNFERVTDRLNKGLLDFALIVQEMDTSSYQMLPIPYQDTWGLLMPAHAPLAKKETLDIADLLDLPLIVSRQGFTDEMPNPIKKQEERLQIVATYDLIYNASLFVREGLGYALTFDHLVSTDANSGLVFRPIMPQITSPMKLIWSKQQPLSQAAQVFLSTFQDLLASLNKAKKTN